MGEGVSEYSINGLIGFTGFVGSALLKQTSFESLYRSSNINEIDYKVFETVVCAGAPGHKWIANKDPEGDLQKIKDLISHLETIQCNTFILISTVDVFKSPINVDENAPIDEMDLHPYGLHRRLLEKFVESNFENYLIVRLPGLVGPGLRKNLIFDFLNNNNLDMINISSLFQFYPMVNLWSDIQTALVNKIKLIHLTAEPILVADVGFKGFGMSFNHNLSNPLVRYDFKTSFAEVFGKKGYYQYSQAETLLAIRTYAQSEPKTLKKLEI